MVNGGLIPAHRARDFIFVVDDGGFLLGVRQGQSLFDLLHVVAVGVFDQIMVDQVMGEGNKGVDDFLLMVGHVVVLSILKFEHVVQDGEGLGVAFFHGAVARIGPGQVVLYVGNLDGDGVAVAAVSNAADVIEVNFTFTSGQNIHDIHGAGVDAHGFEVFQGHVGVFDYVVQHGGNLDELHCAVVEALGHGDGVEDIRFTEELRPSHVIHIQFDTRADGHEELEQGDE